MDAAHSDNLSLEEFSQKPDWYQGLIIAKYRGKNQIEAVLYENQRVEDERRRMEQEAIRMSSGNRING